LGKYVSNPYEKKEAVLLGRPQVKIRSVTFIVSYQDSMIR
jgi:hypothetical protein